MDRSDVRNVRSHHQWRRTQDSPEGRIPSLLAGPRPWADRGSGRTRSRCGEPYRPRSRPETEAAPLRRSARDGRLVGTPRSGQSPSPSYTAHWCDIAISGGLTQKASREGALANDAERFHGRSTVGLPLGDASALEGYSTARSGGKHRPRLEYGTVRSPVMVQSSRTVPGSGRWVGPAGRCRKDRLEGCRDPSTSSAPTCRPLPAFFTDRSAHTDGASYTVGVPAESETRATDLSTRPPQTPASRSAQPSRPNSGWVRSSEDAPNHRDDGEYPDLQYELPRSPRGCSRARTAGCARENADSIAATVQFALAS